MSALERYRAVVEKCLERHRSVGRIYAYETDTTASFDIDAVTLRLNGVDGSGFDLCPLRGPERREWFVLVLPYREMPWDAWTLVSRTTMLSFPARDEPTARIEMSVALDAARTMVLTPAPPPRTTGPTLTRVSPGPLEAVLARRRPRPGTR